MPLKTFFQDQMDQLRAFMESPEETLRCVQVAPDIKQLLLRTLVAMDQNAENPHIFIASDTAFAEPLPFLDALYERVHAEFSHWQAELHRQGIDVGPTLRRFSETPQPDKFVQFFSTLAEDLPDRVGALVLVLDPAAIQAPEPFLRTMTYLADHTTSQWAKYLILDELPTSWLIRPDERSERIGVQVFDLPPDEIERQVKEDLKGGALSPIEKRRYTALQAGFAFGKKQYDEAQRLQEAWIQMAVADDEPAEAASAYYNLGNTQLEKKDYEAAEESFLKAGDLCLDHELNALVPLVLTNLGVTLYHQNRLPEALDSFKVALDTNVALNNKPGEAHVLDCMASTLAADGYNADAEQNWLEALEIYRGITSEAFTDLREAGVNDIMHKLEHHYKKLGQHDKLAQLKQETHA